MDVWTLDRVKYDICIFFVNDNHHKETLISIIEDNIYTCSNHLNQNKDNNENYYATKIYSDSFSTYQIKDFNDNGYILYKVSHSIWFGSGKFNTNTIEGVWSRIKRITDNFIGLNAVIYNKFGNANNLIEYINALICAGLFFMRCEHLQIGEN